MSEYGYLNHTSTEKRDAEAIRAMFAVLPFEQITIEQMWSPGEKHRPAFEALIDRLHPGDTLYVHSLDRLGIDAAEAARVWKTVTKRKSAHICVLDDDRLDSRRNPQLSASDIRRAADQAFAQTAERMADQARSYTSFQLIEATSGE